MFKSETIKRAWEIRKAAAKKFQEKILHISWKECLKMAMNGEKIEIEKIDLQFDANIIPGRDYRDVVEPKFYQAVGNLEDDGETLEIRSILPWNFQPKKSLKVRSHTEKGHFAFEMDPENGRVQVWGNPVPTKIKRIKGDTYPFRSIFKKSFSWNAHTKMWERRLA